MEYRYRAIVIGKRDVGETDRIYTFYTLEGGKVKALAQGVRKAHARLASQLENFMLVDLVVAKGRGMGRVTGSIIEESFSELRKSYDALRISFDLISNFDRLVDVGSVDQQLFENLLELFITLNELADNEKLVSMDTVALSFLIHLTSCLGYRIETKACIHCCQKLMGDRFLFIPRDGGFYCDQCANKSQREGIVVDKNSLKFIHLASQHRVRSFSKLTVSKQDQIAIRLMLSRFIYWIRG